MYHFDITYKCRNYVYICRSSFPMTHTKLWFSIIWWCNEYIKIITKLHLAQNPIFEHFTSWSLIHWHAFSFFSFFLIFSFSFSFSFFLLFCSTLGYQVHFLDIMLDFLVKQISRPTTREKSSGLNIVSDKNPL